MQDLKWDEPATEEVEVDEETLAAIDRGIEDADAGRTIPLEQVREMIPQWIQSSNHAKSVSRSAGDLRILLVQLPGHR
jgi:hypothetical protein